MKRSIVLTVLLFSCCFCLSTLSAQTIDTTKISPRLYRQMIQSNSPSHYRIGILLADRVRVEELDADFHKLQTPLPVRAYEIITQLQAKAAATQPPLKAWLDTQTHAWTGTLRSFWITNALYLQATPALISELSLRPDVAEIIEDVPVVLEAYQDHPDLAPTQTTGVEEGLVAINAPAMWNLGYTGYARKVLNIDSGIDGLHPCYSDRYWGHYVPDEEAWFDARTGTLFPDYCSDHGTHVLGTILGLDEGLEDTIGVAFGALWMGAPAICDNYSSDNIAAFEWAIDPDGNPLTTDDMPDVINNSWRAIDVGNECTSLMYAPVLSAMEAAGIAIVFSAGNSGPSSMTITPPKNLNASLVNTFCVGAINGNSPDLNIMSFSSRGPSVCGGSGSMAIKPEVSAPGFQVRSAKPNHSYGRKSGTSMAAPHVTGALLLLKEAFPQLSGTDLKLALYHSAVDMGAIGEDNDYGMGLIDVHAAYLYLITQGHSPTPINNDVNAAITDIFGLPQLNCPEPVAPIIEVENRGTQVITSLNIVYQYGLGAGGKVNWAGFLPPDSTVVIPLPAEPLAGGGYEFTVRIASANNQTEEYFYLDNRRQQNFYVAEELQPNPKRVTVCKGGTALLAAYGPGEVRWFEGEYSDSVIHVGNTLIIPDADSSKTFWSEIRPEIHAGPRTKIRTTLNVDEKSGIMNFNAERNFRLVSVKVYSERAETRKFVLLNATSQILFNEDIWVDKGVQEVPLNIDIPAGMHYRLQLPDSNGFHRDTVGAAYPYEIPGVLSIYGSSRGATGYDFLYDWVITITNPCDRTPVSMEVQNGSVNAAFAVDSLTPRNIGELAFLDKSIGAKAWHYDFGDGAYSDQQHPIHRFRSAGTYDVWLSAVGPDGCEDAVMESVFVDSASITTTIDPLVETLQTFKVVPNPGANHFEVVGTLPQFGAVEVSLYNHTGQRLMTLPASKGTSHQMRLDLTGYAHGIYMVQIQHQGRTAWLKLVQMP
ncbi:S8 family serine peptidase [Pontibacter sp. G13]|uniref:S8 family serine peptidase n=1 Tax=Pontibacter sp. G13 TaxID=3074898 RepID=UPI0028892F20|nr:S8 family serine peptidase [Pontibacter sp. G13]WNJ21208.1 S8 family serine peptidase [Pontibacter sp. G13]